VAATASGRSSTSRLRILVVSSCPETWGGSEELWWAGTQRLLDRGHRVEVRRLVVDSTHRRVVALRARACSVGTLTTRADGLASAASALGPRRVHLDERRQAALVAAAVMIRRRPDLVIVSQGQNYDGLLFAHVCRRLRLSYLLISQKASEVYWPPDEARARHRRAYLDATASIFVSEHNRRVTEEQLGGPIPAARVMRNPVLIGHDGPLPWPPGQRVRIACLARLCVAEKGQDTLLRVLAREPWRSRDIELGLYGTGFNREGLEALARSLCLDNVTFHGSTDDVLAVWRDHHMLALASRTEGLPLVLVEAMMCGRVVVATNVGGTAEVVEDGVTGFVACGAEADAFEAALERAWQRGPEWEAIGGRAAASIRDLFPGGPDAAGNELATLVEAVGR
jgi:glycosyltransferase involved in cell wall biosynthesis